MTRYLKDRFDSKQFLFAFNKSFQNFEIPLGCFKECKNLLLAGSIPSIGIDIAGFEESSCSSQMGACWNDCFLCLQKKRLPKTLTDKGYIDK